MLEILKFIRQLSDSICVFRDPSHAIWADLCSNCVHGYDEPDLPFISEPICDCLYRRHSYLFSLRVRERVASLTCIIDVEGASAICEVQQE